MTTGSGSQGVTTRKREIRTIIEATEVLVHQMVTGTEADVDLVLSTSQADQVRLLVFDPRWQKIFAPKPKP